MKFESLLKITLVIASLVQFFLSFVKARSNRKDYGVRLFTLNMSYTKRKLLALLFVGIIMYFAYIIVTGNFNILGMLIVVYFLLSIYDFCKLKIITSEGIGQKSFYSNAYYNFTNWSDIFEWNWSKDKKNLLIFKVKKNSRIETKDWLVSNSEIESIDQLFQKYTNNNIL